MGAPSCNHMKAVQQKTAFCAMGIFCPMYKSSSSTFSWVLLDGRPACISEAIPSQNLNEHETRRREMRLLMFSLGFVFYTVTTTSIPTLHRDIGRDRQGSLNERLSYSSPTLHYGDPTFPVLSKRARHNLQIHHVEIQSFAVPFFNAAAALAFFYSSIIQRCLNEWTAFPPLYHLRITNGYFSLMLYGNGGRIPWTLVAEMAGNMLMMTQRGFMGTYDLWYVNGGYKGHLPAALGGGGSETGSPDGPGVLVQFRFERRIGNGIVDIGASVLGGPS